MFSFLSNKIHMEIFWLKKFIWKSKSPFKFKAFAWLMANKKFNTNDFLEMSRRYKALTPDCYPMYGEYRLDCSSFFYSVWWLWGCGICYLD